MKCKNILTVILASLASSLTSSDLPTRCSFSMPHSSFVYTYIVSEVNALMSHIDFWGHNGGNILNWRWNHSPLGCTFRSKDEDQNNYSESDTTWMMIWIWRHVNQMIRQDWNRIFSLTLWNHDYNYCNLFSTVKLHVAELAEFANFVK